MPTAEPGFKLPYVDTVVSRQIVDNIDTAVGLIWAMYAVFMEIIEGEGGLLSDPDPDLSTV